jgi:polyhydroxybutyrate depolymerase
MKRISILVLISVLFAACSTTSEPTIQPGDFERNVTVDDLDRSYLLHVPSGLNNSQAIPVVFVFHGRNHNPGTIRGSSGMDEISDSNNFLVIYPAGIEDSWNAGGGNPNLGYAIAHNVDDPAFVREILKDLESFITIDHNRIFAAGHSQGGMLVYRLACEMSDTFAAIASVAGVHFLSDCTPEEGVSIIHIHALKDGFVPFTGDDLKLFPPVNEGIDTWVELNDCSDSFIEEDEEEGITHLIYSSCRSGTAVELYTTTSGTHSWSRIGIPATDVIWDFFAEHPKPD